MIDWSDPTFRFPGGLASVLLFCFIVFGLQSDSNGKSNSKCTIINVSSVKLTHRWQLTSYNLLGVISFYKKWSITIVKKNTIYFTLPTSLCTISHEYTRSMSVFCLSAIRKLHVFKNSNIVFVLFSSIHYSFLIERISFVHLSPL